MADQPRLREVERYGDPPGRLPSTSRDVAYHLLSLLVIVGTGRSQPSTLVRKAYIHQLFGASLHINVIYLFIDLEAGRSGDDRCRWILIEFEKESGVEGRLPLTNSLTYLATFRAAESDLPSR